ATEPKDCVCATRDANSRSPIECPGPHDRGR
ncbi:MAG: hypothetical protein AVDCRST_MAG56-1535, partial [uncultured Cytophagales bacterium]